MVVLHPYFYSYKYYARVCAFGFAYGALFEWICIKTGAYDSLRITKAKNLVKYENERKRREEQLLEENQEKNSNEK